MKTLFEFLILSLACYRLALLLSEDAGPWKMFRKLRSFLKREAKQHPAFRKSAVHEGVECIRCNSIWLAVPIAVYAHYRGEWDARVVVAGDIFLACMALSAGAILINRIPKR